MAHEYVIVDSENGHVVKLAKMLREGDKAEIAAGGLTPNKAIWKSYRSSILCRTAFVDGEIAAMWGLAGTMMSNVGHPWLLTAYPSERVPIAFVKEGRKAVQEMLTIKPVLFNYVLASYHRAIGFLRLSGFTVSDPELFGVNHEPFCRFEMRAN